MTADSTPQHHNDGPDLGPGLRRLVDRMVVAMITLNIGTVFTIGQLGKDAAQDDIALTAALVLAGLGLVGTFLFAARGALLELLLGRSDNSTEARNRFYNAYYSRRTRWLLSASLTASGAGFATLLWELSDLAGKVFVVAGGLAILLLGVALAMINYRSSPVP